MASQQAYQAYAHQNKGTLTPGQTISVNKYTVQVERYLSQGGFAHVYLVRTPQPVYNTTHHVLKRIAVANESMLSEVKREVDVMRVLKGHPNIVHLIDAAWHRLPNGTYEVFILMEFCPGGGIIDMMNRRLRERLTEAEILQIFVDVCEGVAFMHNSRPPLLHRDLKVENILQSSPTSYKLCDFGSATTVSRPPTNTQEIRLLEADLGRHTTMQYRAPEMIDLYSKRPIDEKSDIWALGVLLYKLCYYTTPFEEHGSLAILNVQYRIPPYPTYSNQMNMLIASMLREHGTQRPSIFELLKHVHHLRGTKSAFTYNLPVQQPAIPPRTAQIAPKPSPSPMVAPRSAPATSGSPPKNQGVQARDKVLEAIAPMRRGRPNHSREGSTSRHPSPHKKPVATKDLNWLDQEEASMRSSAQAEARQRANAMFDEAWNVPSATPAKQSDKPMSFESDFADKLWHTPSLTATVSTPPPKISPKPTTHLQLSNTVIRPLAYTGTETTRGTRDKDAFEGLGLMTSIGKPAPTLAEARKLRTGLAIMSTQTHHYHKSPSDNSSRVVGNSHSTRPTPSPRPSYLAPSTAGVQGSSRSPTPNTDAWRGSPASASPSTGSASKEGVVPIESRFPSLEELDAQFSATSLYPASTHVNSDSRLSTRQTQPASGPSPALPPRPALNGQKESMDRPTRHAQPTSGPSPALPPRTALSGQKESTDRPTRYNAHASAPASLDSAEKKPDAHSAKSDWKPSSSRLVNTTHRTEPSRPQGGSATMRLAMEEMKPSPPPPPKSEPVIGSTTMRLAMEEIKSTPSKHATTSSTSLLGDTFRTSASPSKYSSRPVPKQDWLTGDDDATSTPIEKTTTGPVVRDTAAKRKSTLVQNDLKLQSPIAATYDTTPIMPETPLPPEESPTVSRFAKNFPMIDTASANESGNRNEPLTENWSPVMSREPSSQGVSRFPFKEKELDSASSADEEEPEDLGELDRSPQKGSFCARHKARQSSVHELVDLWGGSTVKEKPREAEATPTKSSAASEQSARTPKPRPTSLLPATRKTPHVNKSVTGNASPLPSPAAVPSPSEPYFSPTVSQHASAVSPGTPSRRPRPQSMFSFPASKPIESSQSQSQSHSNYSSNLVAPPDETPAARRKNSITDMVSRYEAIGGKVIAPQQVGAVSIARKPSITRSGVPPSQVEVGRVKVLPVPEKAPPSAPSSRDEYRPARIADNPHLRGRTTSTGPVRGAPAVKAIDTPRNVVKPPVDRAASPTKKTHAVPIQTQRPAGHRHEPSTSAAAPVFPKRKPTLPSADDPVPTSLTSPTPSSDGRSSSPERPYQGVGKLIDQWQRKTEQPETFARPVAKRAGLVQGHRG